MFWSQVEQNRVKLLNDQAVAKSQLQKKLGQFLYLTNLEKVIFILDSKEEALEMFSFHL